MGDELWHLGLSEPVLIAIFGAVMLLATIGIVVWGAAVPEKDPGPEIDRTAALVAREREAAEVVEHDLEDQTGRSDPAVAWTR